MILARLLAPGARSTVRDLAPAVACGVLAGTVVVAQAALLSRVVDQAFLGRAPLASLAPWLAALVAIAAARAGLLWLQEDLAQSTSGRVRLEVRDRLVRRVLALGPRYATGERAGELANTLAGGVEALDAYVAQYLPQAALAALVPGVVLAAVLWADPLSALVLALTYPLVPLFMWLIGSAAEARTRRQWQLVSRLAARFQDALAGLATLKAFGRVEDELRVIERVNERHRSVTMEVLRLAFVSALVLEALATLGTAVVAVEVGLRLLYARLAFGEALFVLVLAPEFYRPLRALGAAFHAGMAGREAALRMAEIHEAGGLLAAPGLLAREASDSAATGMSGCGDDATASPVPAAAETTLTQPSRPLESVAATTDIMRRGPGPRGAPPRVGFDSVAFCYEPGRGRALDGFTLEIPSGETLALVGPTGAGKTTAAQLLLRFLEPTAGRIVVDGAPLAERTPEEWRRHVAWVPQHPRLFHASLRDNLRLARASATEAELDRALSLAGLEALVRDLPRGLDTEVGEGGERLSGGEAQRVAVARAFLKDAPLLVLDEPTAQLDLATEALVLGAVQRLRQGRTVLLVAHRLTTVAAAERVAVLSGGRLVEQGSPGALARSGAVYPRLLAAWGDSS